ncbi:MULTISPECIES: hypothetical protein [unclassified Neisseria]|uniref:hypothetical protein n=1 Tax=unclassified Neisseria TaxID=2623750 RepID=UPI0010718C4F|nr:MULTISPECIES: hypothetical protein [unclassified Neisseria]MBF0803154.1 hypothetical protein [Neisseria sp. 19428wB4_WF04]TFU44275.1 hypothetical protein E4T99_02080 [Neisseria sp. WF04]
MQTKGGNLPPLSGQTPIQRRPPKPLQNSKKHHKKFYLPLRPPAREAGYSAFQNFFHPYSNIFYLSFRPRGSGGIKAFQTALRCFAAVAGNMQVV